MLRRILFVACIVACHAALDLVLCRFREPMPAIVEFVERVKREVPMDVRVFLYSQGEQVVAPSDWHVHVFEVNAGREGRCFLHHLVHYSMRSAEHVWFSQALHINPQLWTRLATFSERTGMLGLAGADTCSCTHCNGADEAVHHHLAEVYALATRSVCTREPWQAFYNGVFIVSRRRIQDQPAWLYAHLLGLLEAPAGHPIYRLEDGRISTPDTPFFGHTIERSWSAIFKCFEATCCDTCACQCFDS